MKKTIVIAGVAILLSSTLWAQDNMQHNNQQKDQNKTEMQKDDMNSKKTKKDSTRKMNKNITMIAAGKWITTNQTSKIIAALPPSNGTWTLQSIITDSSQVTNQITYDKHI